MRLNADVTFQSKTCVIDKYQRGQASNLIAQNEFGAANSSVGDAEISRVVVSCPRAAIDMVGTQLPTLICSLECSQHPLYNGIDLEELLDWPIR